MQTTRYSTYSVCDISLDFQLLRCIVKILEVVYPNVKSVPAGTLTPRKRSASRVISKEHDLNHSARSSRQNSDDVSSANTEPGENTTKVVSQAETIIEIMAEHESGEYVHAADSLSCPAEITAEDTENEDKEFIKKMTPILYEVIQNLLVDVVSVLDKVSSMLSGCSNNGVLV